MRRDILKTLEMEFLSIHPLGFNDPEMIEIGKKHKIGKMHVMALDMFAKDNFHDIDKTIENMIKIISRASMVSLFEKPKFRDFVRSLSAERKELLVMGLYKCLHGNLEEGFNQMLDILLSGKLAKWSLMTIILYYYSPKDEVFCKPTTVKNIVNIFELEGLIYKPRPTYEFYINFRRELLEMKKLVDPNIGFDNAAFSGFLMMMMPNNK